MSHEDFRSQLVPIEDPARDLAERDGKVVPRDGKLARSRGRHHLPPINDDSGFLSAAHTLLEIKQRVETRTAIVTEESEKASQAGEDVTGAIFRAQSKAALTYPYIAGGAEEELSLATDLIGAVTAYSERTGKVPFVAEGRTIALRPSQPGIEIYHSSQSPAAQQDVVSFVRAPLALTRNSNPR